MAGVNHNVDVSETTIMVDVSYIHHQTEKLFRVTDPGADNPISSFSQAISSPSRKEANPSSMATDASLVSGPGPQPPPPVIMGGAVTVPHKCGIHQGQGEFLFMGSVRLGRAHLKCAPRLEEFARMWRKAIHTGRNLCAL